MYNVGKTEYCKFKGKTVQAQYFGLYLVLGPQ